MEKEEVEESLRMDISDETFKEALAYAKRKQKHIYQQKRSKEVLQHWYLVELITEYVKNLTFSELTMDLCRTMRDMEKERPAKTGTPYQPAHIITNSAL